MFNSVAMPLPNTFGQPASVILIADDVTGEARLESELVKAEKLATIGQMLSTINHEITNPLSNYIDQCPDSTHAQRGFR